MLFQLASFVTFCARVRSLCKAGDTCTLEPPIDALVGEVIGDVEVPHGILGNADHVGSNPSVN